MKSYKVNIKMMNEKQFKGEEPDYICETSKYIEEYTLDTALDYYIQYFIDHCVDIGYDVEQISFTELKVVQDSENVYYRFSVEEVK